MRTHEQIQADIDALNALMPKPAAVALTIRKICSMEELEKQVETELMRPGVSVIVSVDSIQDV